MLKAKSARYFNDQLVHRHGDIFPHNGFSRDGDFRRWQLIGTPERRQVRKATIAGNHGAGLEQTPEWAF